jgi:hypothetical protein
MPRNTLRSFGSESHSGGKQFRRWQQCSLELNYINSNCRPSFPKCGVPNLSATDHDWQSINWNAVDESGL